MTPDMTPNTMGTPAIQLVYMYKYSYATHYGHARNSYAYHTLQRNFSFIIILRDFARAGLCDEPFFLPFRCPRPLPIRLSLNLSRDSNVKHSGEDAAPPPFPPTSAAPPLLGIGAQFGRCLLLIIRTGPPIRSPTATGKHMRAAKPAAFKRTMS